MQKINVSKKPSSCHPIFIKIGLDTVTSTGSPRMHFYFTQNLGGRLQNQTTLVRSGHVWGCQKTKKLEEKVTGTMLVNAKTELKHFPI